MVTRKRWRGNRVEGAPTSFRYMRPAGQRWLASMFPAALTTNCRASRQLAPLSLLAEGLDLAHGIVVAAQGQVCTLA